MKKKLAMAAAVIHGPKILFLDEPFEGVDAIASGTLKVMLQRMIERGATIFLTSHVLEIVERLCSHVAIIHHGRLVALGSIEELRRGVEAQASAAANGGEAAISSGEKLTLEEIFVATLKA
jgi:ABC-2 type transport system ATP-binding protein